MNPGLTLTKASLVKLLDSVSNPDPDGSGPLGPGGPVMNPWWQWVMLNPQPLPPGPPPELGLWRFSDPQPQPWRSTLLARAVISTAVSHLQLAEAIVGPEHAEKRFQTVRAQIREFVDDFCGTHPPRWPLPWPWPPKIDPSRLVVRDFFFAGAEFHRAADIGASSPLQAEFAAAADQLFATGFKRMESA